MPPGAPGHRSRNLRIALPTPQVSPSLIAAWPGHFRLLRVLGSGAAGVVYEAEDTVRGQRVAVKFIKKLAAKHDLSHPIREADLASKVGHPHIVACLGSGSYA